MHRPNVTDSAGGGRARRRTLLVACGALATASLAGCEQVFLGSEFSGDGPPDDLRAAARTFVEHVEAGEFEAATEPFTAELESQLPAERLASTWDETVGHLGDFEEISRWGHDEAEGLDRVFARVRRTEGHYDLQLTFDARARIAGVFIRDVSG